MILDVFSYYDEIQMDFWQYRVLNCILVFLFFSTIKPSSFSEMHLHSVASSNNSIKFFDHIKFFRRFFLLDSFFHVKFFRRSSHLMEETKTGL